MSPPLVTRQVSNLLVVHFIGRLSLETKPRPRSWPTLSIVWRQLKTFTHIIIILLENNKCRRWTILGFHWLHCRPVNTASECQLSTSANVQSCCVITLPCDDHLTTLQHDSSNLKDVTRGTVVNKISSNNKPDSRLQLALGYCNIHTFVSIPTPPNYNVQYLLDYDTPARSDQITIRQKHDSELANETEAKYRVPTGLLQSNSLNFPWLFKSKNDNFPDLIETITPSHKW